MINRYRQDKEKAGDTANIDLDVSLYVICELLKPDCVLTPDDLAKSLPFAAFPELNQALEAVGFTLPQLQGTTTP